MRQRGRSTFGIAAIVSVVFALATLGIGVVAYDVTHEALEEQLDHRIAAETRALLAESRGGAAIDQLAVAIARRNEAREPDALRHLLIDAGGTRRAGALDADAPVKPGYHELLPHSGGLRVAQALTTLLPDGGRLVVAADREPLDEADAHLLILFALAFGTMIVLGVAGAWTVGAVTRARLARIDGAAQGIIGGDLTRRMPVDGSGSEFDALSTTLNRMLDRITALMENLRQVSSDVAHDLRTPLTRLGNHLSEAQASHDGASRDAAIAAAATQAEDLLEIFAALLRISEVESFGVRRQFRRVALGEELADLLDTYRPDFEARGHVIIDAIDRAVTVDGDRRLLLQLVSNLFENALRHTPPGTGIRIALAPALSSGSAILVVGDDGPGVSVQDAPRLFERFARSERSRSTDGHGLGLAMVAAIAAAHNGSARLLPGAGFTIEITLGENHI